LRRKLVWRREAKRRRILGKREERAGPEKGVAFRAGPLGGNLVSLGERESFSKNRRCLGEKVRSSRLWRREINNRRGERDTAPYAIGREE